MAYELKKHNYKEGQTFLANCAYEGSQQVVCTECGSEYWKTLPKTDDHKWVSQGYYFPDRCIWCYKQKSGSQQESPAYASSGSPLWSYTSSNNQVATQPIIWDVAAVDRT